MEHRLRPTFFAFEDRQQITDLFVESYTRLAIAVGISTKGVVSPAKLWEKLMLLKLLQLQET